MVFTVVDCRFVTFCDFYIPYTANGLIYLPELFIYILFSVVLILFLNAIFTLQRECDVNFRIVSAIAVI